MPTNPPIPLSISKIFISLPHFQVAKNLEELFAKVGRADWPKAWPDLFPNLLQQLEQAPPLKLARVIGNIIIILVVVLVVVVILVVVVDLAVKFI